MPTQAAAPGSIADRGLDLDRPVRSVLFVCTGNVCRSPFAELLLASRAPHLRVTSRGTYSLTGEPMDRDMAAELEARGVFPAGFVSRPLAAAQLDADLVLAMEPAHLEVIADEQPAALLRSGLLGHARPLAAAAGDRPLTVRDVRAWSRSARSAEGSIADPYRRGRRAASATAAEVQDLVELLASALAPTGDAA